MKKIEKGDYILSNTEVWEVLDIHELSHGKNLYTLKQISQPSESIELFNPDLGEPEEHKIPRILNGVTEAYIARLGTVVPKDSEKVIKIFFGN